MNKLTKLFMVGAFSSILSVVPVRAGTLNFQTYFKVKTVKIQNNHDGYLNVFNGKDEKLFAAKRDVKTMYTTVTLNIRKAPSVDSKVIKLYKSVQN